MALGTAVRIRDMVDESSWSPKVVEVSLSFLRLISNSMTSLRRPMRLGGALEPWRTQFVPGLIGSGRRGRVDCGDQAGSSVKLKGVIQ